MPKADAPKKSSQPKGESITIRVNPKIKYGVELLSRKQHRSLTSVVEWAIDKALKDSQDGFFFPDELYDPVTGRRSSDALELLWDPDEISRFIKLAYGWKSLMTYDKVIA